MSSSNEFGRRRQKRQPPTIRIRPEDNPEIIPTGQGGRGGATSEREGGEEEEEELLSSLLPSEHSIPLRGGGRLLTSRDPNPNALEHRPHNKKQKRMLFIGSSEGDDDALLNPAYDFDDEDSEQSPPSSPE